MDYAKAAALVAQHAPELTIDPDVGQKHINVRRTANGPPHSIMLLVSTEAVPVTEEEMEESFVASIATAKTFI